MSFDRNSIIPNTVLRIKLLFMQGLKSVLICVFLKFYLCVALRHVMQ